MATNIAQRGLDNVKILGKNELLFVNASKYGVPTADSPIWTLVGGQRGASLEMSAEEIDVSDKTSSGWGDTLPGTKTWSVSLDLVKVLGNDGFEAIQQAFLNDQEIQVMIWNTSGHATMGWCSVTEFSSEAPHDDVVSISGTLSGRGAPVFLENIDYPGGVQDLTVTKGTGQAVLNWTALSDAISLKAQYSTNKISWTDSANMIAANASTATIDNLSSGTTYYFRLFVTGGSKTGFSNMVEATID